MIEVLLVGGYSPKDIYKEHGTSWGVTLRTVRAYCTRVTKRLSNSQELVRAAELTKAIRRFNRLYKENVNGLDRKLALSAASKICEVLKLGDLGKLDLNVNLSGKVENEHSITPGQAETIFGILEGAGALEAFAPGSTSK